MTTTDPFSVFDYPQQILWIPITPGYTEQDTGRLHPRGEGPPVAICGDLKDITARDLQRLPEGLYEIGDRRFTTTQLLSPGDFLDITELDGATVTRWTINKQQESSTPLLSSSAGILRRTYALNLKSI
ncbi:MAG: hypothetical protein PHP59_08220 [Methanofollis sp.]|uniref:hypothetical protein n=1 Tax=Methanofollis sp. TaxID=2052835 RepID=UPI002634465E|nr:hypothetical protein [Methanofollis sp.]MDD4255345.1 hypothetical protein [Methanofollis sp.]